MPISCLARRCAAKDVYLLDLLFCTKQPAFLALFILQLRTATRLFLVSYFRRFRTKSNIHNRLFRSCCSAPTIFHSHELSPTTQSPLTIEQHLLTSPQTIAAMTNSRASKPVKRERQRITRTACEPCREKRAKVCRTNSHPLYPNSSI
jgi:hypothetical protein